MSAPDYDVVWAPIPNTSQEFALDSRCNHTLYCGTRGPGKTDTQLMRFRRRVGVGYGKFWQGIIFDRQYKNLDDLIKKSLRWFPQFNDGAKFLASTSQLKWVWPTGEELLFRVAEKESDYWDYHGHEYPFIGWNELTKYPDPKLYDMMMSTNRSSYRPEDYPVTIDGDLYRATGQIQFVHESDERATKFLLPPIPLEVFSTTNPFGPGHGWVKNRFISPAEYGQVVRKTIRVTDPKTKQEVDVVKSQVAIFGSYVENIYLDVQYVATLNEEKDENRRKAWLQGDWDVIAGGAFDDVWKRNVHVVPRFVIPDGWRMDRAFDWGSTEPFSVGWYAEANGEEATIVYNGQSFSFCPRPGSIIMFGEWYGSKEWEEHGTIGLNEGLKLGPTTIAEGIKEREEVMVANGWIPERPQAGPADNQIWNQNDSETESLADRMSKVGIEWEKSNKSKDTRVVGLDLARERFDNSVTGEGPGLYIMDNCRAAITVIPTLQRDPKKLNDVDTTTEEHIWDQLRYRVLRSARKVTTGLKVTYAV